MVMIPYAPWLAIFVPFIGAMLSPFFGKLNSKFRDYFEVFCSFIAALAAVSMIPDVFTGKVSVNGVSYGLPFDWRVNWLPNIDAGVLVDPLSVFMANVAADIGFLIMVYSLEYMEHDPSKTRYWFFMNLFIGFMLLLVTADNFLQMFIGWEGVGLCSYALIGFWYRDEKDKWLGPYPPSHCGMKAFITTRIGDVGLLISILIVYYFSGTFNFMELQSNFSWLKDLVSTGLLTLTTLLLFLGPIGKSAQFPLHVWLPEAMAGPTTVSALIHAATMVKAGVYLVARVSLIFYSAYASHALGFTAIEPFFITVAWIGGFTAFLSASMALVQDQIKKVLAYSTISQIGYMMLALGVGGLAFKATEEFVVAYNAGVFHLMSHAVFKALLFLGAGAVLHATETMYMSEMGGLKDRMPKTFITFTVGALSLSGIPPFSGFWSKESIFHACLASHQYMLLAVASVTAALTFFYALRMVGLTFLGEESEHIRKLEREGHHVHDPSIIMWGPLAVLAAVTFIGGAFQPFLEKFFSYSLPSIELIPFTEAVTETFASPTFMATVLMLLLGGIPGYMLYISRTMSPREIIERNVLLRSIYTFLLNRWYINSLYFKVFVDGAIWLSGAVRKTVEWGIDRFNYKVADTAVYVSSKFRKVQTGLLSWNMIYIMLGFLFLILYWIVVVWWM